MVLGNLSVLGHPIFLWCIEVPYFYGVSRYLKAGAF